MSVLWEIFNLTSSAFIFKLRSLYEEVRVFKCMKVREVLSIVGMIYGSALPRQPALWYVFSYFRHSAPLHLFHCVLSESSFHYQAPPGVKNMSLFSFSLWIGLNALVVAYILLEAHALSHLPESCFYVRESCCLFITFERGINANNTFSILPLWATTA